MIELTVSATIFALALLSTGLTLLHGVRSQDESTVYSDSLRAVRSVFAEVQQMVNQPQDLSTFQGISAVYTLYNGSTRAVPNLPNGTVAITVYPNEATVPAELGGPQDLNFDGEAIVIDAKSGDVIIRPAIKSLGPILPRYLCTGCYPGAS